MRLKVSVLTDAQQQEWRQLVVAANGTEVEWRTRLAETVLAVDAELGAVRRERDRLYRALQVMFRSEQDLEEYLACVVDGNCRCPGRWREAKA